MRLVLVDNLLLHVIDDGLILFQLLLVVLDVLLSFLLLTCELLILTSHHLDLSIESTNDAQELLIRLGNFFRSGKTCFSLLKVILQFDDVRQTVSLLHL